jgi:hypothetical protein
VLSSPKQPSPKGFLPPILRPPLMPSNFVGADEGDYFPLNLPEDRPDTPFSIPNLKPQGPRDIDEV